MYTLMCPTFSACKDFSYSLPISPYPIMVAELWLKSVLAIWLANCSDDIGGLTLWLKWSRLSDICLHRGLLRIGNEAIVHLV